MTSEDMKTTGKTTAFDSGDVVPPSLTLRCRQHSNPTISRLIAESMCKPQSPMTPSPTGSAEVQSILHRLEHIEIESRELLTNLFSMVQTDARLEKYIRKRLEDPKVSAMWELVEQILDAQKAQLDIEKMLMNVDQDYGNRLGSWSSLSTDKSVSSSDEDGSMRIQRFKVRRFDIDYVDALHPTTYPPPHEELPPPTKG